jgi:hypothetical protein
LDVSSCRFLRSPSATSELSGIDRQFDSSDHPLMRCGIPRWDTWAPCGMLQNNDYHRYTVHGIRLVRRGHMTDAESFTSRLPALRSKCFGGFRISLESTTTFHANVHPTCLLRSIYPRRCQEHLFGTQMHSNPEEGVCILTWELS